MKITNYETNLQNNVVEYYIEVFHKAAHNDQFNYKLIDSILQKLTMKRAVLSLERITLYQLFCIKRIPGIDIVECKTRPGEFHMIETESKNLAAHYTKLMNDTFALAEKISNDGYNSQELFPLSTYVDIKIKCSMRDFMKFIQICLKYDELSDIVEGMLEFEMDAIVHLSNIVTGENIFSIDELDPIVKGELSDDEKLVNILKSTKIDGVTEYEIIGCLNIQAMIALSPYVHLSEMIMENPYLVMTEYLDSPVDIVLSEKIMLSDKLDDIYELVNKWLDLITECMEIEGDVSKNILNMQLLCFGYKFMMSIDSDKIDFIRKESKNPDVECFMYQLIQSMDINEEDINSPYEDINLI